MAGTSDPTVGAPEAASPDAATTDGLATRRITRRDVLKVGVVAVPCLAGSALLFDWLTGLGNEAATENAEPIVATYDASAHRWGIRGRHEYVHRLRAVRGRLQGREPCARRVPSTRAPGSSGTRPSPAAVHIDAPDGGIDGYEPGVAPPGVELASVTDMRFVPRLCMQCENPPCVAVCPVGATYQTPDGVVLIDEERCIGCGYCVIACPYGARYIVPAGERFATGRGRRGRQVHVLLPPDHGRAASGLRGGLSGRRPPVRRSQRSRESRQRGPRGTADDRAQARARHASRASTTSASAARWCHDRPCRRSRAGTPARRRRARDPGRDRPNPTRRCGSGTRSW